MTPVEIFKPHYANAIATYIVSRLKEKNLFEKFNEKEIFHMCEIGAGNGTCMKSVLDYLKENYPQLYEYVLKKKLAIFERNMFSGSFLLFFFFYFFSLFFSFCPFFFLFSFSFLFYFASVFFFWFSSNSFSFLRNTRCTIIDVSSPFIQQQKSTLSSHNLKIEFKNISIFDWKTFNENNGFIIAMELLDNLPHDKLILTREQKLKETFVSIEKDGKMIEEHFPVTDPLIVEILNELCVYYEIPPFSWSSKSINYNLGQTQILWNFLFNPVKRKNGKKFSDFFSFYYQHLALSGPEARFIYLPTSSFLLIKNLKIYFPKHEIIFADFDFLSNSLGTNSPLIQKTIGNSTIEQESYLNTPLGDNDILFPTNFKNLFGLFFFNSLFFLFSDSSFFFSCYFLFFFLILVLFFFSSQSFLAHFLLLLFFVAPSFFPFFFFEIL